MRSIAIASGKGGVGKTSIALNLGLWLAKTGKKVVVVDADLDMANLNILLGAELNPITLHNVLTGENSVSDAIYEGPEKMYYVPSAVREEKTPFDLGLFRSAVSKLELSHDFIFIDCPPGLREEARAAIKSARELVLITTPEPTAVIDALKVKRFAEKNNVKTIGIVLNRVSGDKNELSQKDVQTLLTAPVIQVLPEDPEVRTSSLLQKPVMLRAPNSPFSNGLKTLANKLTGQKLVTEQTVKKSVFQTLKEKILALFKRR